MRFLTLLFAVFMFAASAAAPLALACGAGGGDKGGDTTEAIES